MKKRLYVVLLIASIILLSACGAEKTVSVDDEVTQGTTLTNTTETEEKATAESITSETTPDLSTESTSIQDEAVDTGDWKAVYLRFLQEWKDKNAEMATIGSAEYAFVTVQGLEYPVMVLFDGWRMCDVFTFEHGQVLSVKDTDGNEINILTDLPIYLWNDNLYFFGASGAPAIQVTNEVSVKNNTLKSEVIASAVYASSLGDKDYFKGRNDAEITESAYNEIVDGIKANGTEIEFTSLTDLEG